ncbi:MAG: hypothetical protein IPJ82_06255 [Lewinellaceae bacterium]|nr:hypothetical protein [Lewinellaceae bacterium]
MQQNNGQWPAPGRIPTEGAFSAFSSPFITRFWGAITCFTLLLSHSCTGIRTEQYFPVTTLQAEKRPKISPSCNDWRAYLPDVAHPEYLPVRHLRVNFHILNSSDSSHNFRPPEARTYFKRLLEVANERLDTNVRNWRSPEGTAVLPRRYRYSLTSQPGDDGFYFHFDDSLYYFISQGKNQNNYRRTVIDRYAVGKDSIINIFVLVHPDDSIKSPTYRANSQGIALGTSLKMAGIFEKKEPPENFAGLLNHEIGHILNLSHAWVEDGCPDTDNHPNKCWDWSPDPPCRDQATNNMMDYNAYQIALTPCQIGRLHAVFANLKSPVRRCLMPVWCTRNPDKDLIIRDSVVWDGARDLEGNLTVAPGGSLRLECRLSLPAGGRITVQAGGRLWLDGARLHNACDLEWQGIFVEGNKTRRGEVFTLKTAVFENCPAGKPAKQQKTRGGG